LELLRNRQLSTNPFLHSLLIALPRARSLDRMLQQSGTDLTVGQFLFIQLTTFLASFILLLIYLPLPMVFSLLVAAIITFLVPSAVIKSKQVKRQEKFSELFPDALEFMARSLRAGNPFSASMKAVSEQMPDPIGPEFAITFDEINYGLSINDALYNMGDRVGTEEVRYFIAAVIIQKQTGGNLADLLKRIAEMIRRRVRTYRDIRTQAAEMKMSANVLITLPFLVAGAILVLNPNYLMSLVNDPVGPYVFIGQGVFLVIGYIVMQKMINFRV
ncbi:MAG: hypothetical protein B0D85_00680, partial [Candidatus Sedimenticola endophacoides]